MDFKTLEVALAGGVATVNLNRPEAANAMNEVMWRKIRAAMLVSADLDEATSAAMQKRPAKFSD